MNDLEHEVGVLLLERKSTGVQVTDAGVVMLEEARDILERVEMAIGGAREAAAGRSGRLTIGNIGALTSWLLPPALADFRQRHPEVEIDVLDLPLPGQLAGLSSGALQVAFVPSEDVQGLAPELDRTEVLRSRVMVVVGSAHPLASRAEVSLSELASERIICVGDAGRNDLHRQRTVRILASHGVRPRALKQVASFESLIAFVAGDHGVALVTADLGRRYNDRVVFRRIADEGVDLDFQLFAVCRRVGGSQLARNFVEVMRAGRMATR